MPATFRRLIIVIHILYIAMKKRSGKLEVIKMGIKEEIDQVIREEERKSNRVSRKSVRTTHARNIHPTYFSVLIGKIIFMTRGKPADKKPGDKPAQTVKDKPKVTMLTIFWEDLTNIPKKIVPPVKKKKVPGADESFNDWKEHFEGK